MGALPTSTQNTGTVAKPVAGTYKTSTIGSGMEAAQVDSSSSTLVESEESRLEDFFKDGNNPITMEELQAAKMSNLQIDHVVGMEELIGKDGNFEEIGASQMITCSGIVHAVEKNPTWGTAK